MPLYPNKRNKYSIVDAKTGEVVARFRVKQTANQMLNKLKHLFPEKELEIEENGNSNKVERRYEEK